ncbi:MAG: hypothetical protein ACE14W_08315 [Candidatus Velamenicoccus archaeovorus]
MRLSTTMRTLGGTAKSRAGLMGHQMKDKALERRLEHLDDENQELRTENRVLRDEVKQGRMDLDKVIEMFERHTEEKGSHKGRWLLLAMLAGGGYYAWTKLSGGDGSMWTERMNEALSGVRAGSSTASTPSGRAAT